MTKEEAIQKMRDYGIRFMLDGYAGHALIRTASGDCPITALCNTINNTHYTPDVWDHAAERLDLPIREAALIIDAADGVMVTRRREAEVGALRKQLLSLTDETERTVPVAQEEENEAVLV